ncbi:MAG: hypothetical protein JRI25_26275 [Deltaproteobacteria bacterium]|nr:hypothetical protein [Deltaproteobacteria bacterium]
MVRRHVPNAGERGSALVMTLLVLVVVTMGGTLLMGNLMVERKLTGHAVRKAKALDAAEAGVCEALARIRNQEGPDDTSNPRLVTQVFNVAAGGVPVLGADSTGLATAQPAGEWLPYSTSGRSEDALTIEYKTDPARTVVYRYDTAADPPINTASGLPVFKITSTGICGSDRRRIVSEVIPKPVNAFVKASVACGADIDFIGNAVTCGYNHAADTPTGTGENGRGTSPDCTPWETGSGDLHSSWSTGDITGGGASTSFSSYVPAEAQHMTGFYLGPWETFGMTQSEFWSWTGAPLSSEPGDLHGIFYLDNNGTLQDQSGSFAFHSASGAGFLYVDGDLTLNAGFEYSGLIYVEGDLKINGTAWMVGGLIVRGKTTMKMTGGATVLYSSDGIQRSIAQHGGHFVTLSWRELN